jgi:hypothetical protein
MPLTDTDTSGNGPAAVAPLEPIDVTAKVNTGRSLFVDTGKYPVRFGVRRVAVQLARVIHHHVMVSFLVLGVIVERPVHERLRAAHERAVMIDRIRMVHREHHLPIETIHSPAIAVDAIQNRLAVEQLANGPGIAVLRLHGVSCRSKFIYVNAVLSTLASVIQR